MRFGAESAKGGGDAEMSDPTGQKDLIRLARSKVENSDFTFYPSEDETKVQFLAAERRGMMSGASSDNTSGLRPEEPLLSQKDREKLDALIRAYVGKEAVELKSSFDKLTAIETLKLTDIKIKGVDSPALVSKKISLTDENGRTLELTDLRPDAYFVNIWCQADTPKNLPENYFAADRISAHSGGKTAMIFYPGIDRVGDRLSLLHEIGHLAAPNEMRNAVRADENLREEYNASTKRKKAEEDEILARLDFKHKIPHPVDAAAVLDFLELNSRAERNAWAFALRKYRELLKDGFDLEPSLRTFGDIKEHIHSEALGTYEEQARNFFPDSPKHLGFYSRFYLKRADKNKNK